MGLRLEIAQLAAAVSANVLHGAFRRPAANFPGKAGLVIDPNLIGDLRGRLREGSVVVVGTNGKTTVTNLLADSLEAAGKTIACNRTGANLDSGIATALLKTPSADWGIFESDELWLSKVAPQLKPRFVVLLNLFRDQLDRMGEIDHIQESIVCALASSPDTVLLYNCDDPLCQTIADAVSNRQLAFGIDEDMGLPDDSVVDSGMCPECGTELKYRWRQYGQLGAYCCPACDFGRTSPEYSACNVLLDGRGISLCVQGGRFTDAVVSELVGAYSVYNVLAACVVADCCEVPPDALYRAAASYAPENGRLQRYRLDGREVLLNLAKNPMGFNQNLRIVQNEPGRKAVAFFINDKEADGHDVSWLWDVDFQMLASFDGIRAYAGGQRRNDMQVRLKYAGVNAGLVDDAEDFITKACAEEDATKLFVIANYTALPALKAQLDAIKPRANHGAGVKTRTSDIAKHAVRPKSESTSGGVPSGRLASTGGFGGLSHQLQDERLVIVHLYPRLLNLYGDGGNVTVLAERARKRGVEVDVVRVDLNDSVRFDEADIVFLGGGPDREQRLAAARLLELSSELRAYVESDGVLLAICGGYQILGETWVDDGENVKGLGLIDAWTERVAGGSHDRLVGNIALKSALAKMPVIGYENHAGRTFLGSDCQPFGYITGRCGQGNNGKDGADGVLYRNVVGTYLHGPLLAKNPEVADTLIERALARRAECEGRAKPALSPLDDTAECEANDYMRIKLGLR